jgi:mannose-6-phosphate isomerase-like protein (cupin superfamily)
VRELYRTANPIPDLKPGGYDLNLTRVTFPAQMPSNPPHHRSGAALYFIISGTGANTVDGKIEARGPGSLIYEPHALVHQWGNPGNEPLIFLAFNINPEGAAASGRTSKESIANDGRPTASGGPFDSKPIQKAGGLATRRASSTRRGKSRAASATARPDVYLKNIIPKFRVLTPRLRVYD